MDPRHERLAELLIHHSTRLQAGEHVLIENVEHCTESQHVVYVFGLCFCLRWWIF